MTGQVLPLIVVVLCVAAAALWYRRANGVAHRIDATFDAEQLALLGLEVGSPALLLFTAPGCPPCTVAKRVLDEVGSRRGIPVVTADVTDHPALATAQHVYRAPTVFVVDRRGHAISRIAGVPRDGELDDVLASVESVAA